ncbi:hypothetical protein FOL47_003631, partial [Perkinsus chesapeaki]
ILNDAGSPPTFRSHRATRDGSEITSHIDVTLCSQALVQDINVWKVDWEHSMSMVSDRATITTVISSASQDAVITPWHQRGYFDEEQLLFAQKICGALSVFNGIKQAPTLSWQDAEMLTDNLCDNLAKTVAECRKHRSNADRRPVWWTRELDFAKSRKALAFHKAWQNKRKGPPATYMKATELAEVLFPEEEVDLPQQAEAHGELNSKLVELRKEPCR